jgi:hypothetical protein
LTRSDNVNVFNAVNRHLNSLPQPGLLRPQRITLGGEGSEGGRGEIVFWRFHAKRKPREIMRLRQQFRFFYGDHFLVFHFSNTARETDACETSKLLASVCWDTLPAA